MNELSTIDPIRASLARLPRWMQPFLTWLTAYALPNQQPLLKISAAGHIMLSASTLLLCVVAGVLLSRYLIS